MHWLKLDFEGINYALTHIYIIQMSLALQFVIKLQGGYVTR
jgi:hypothetical protein